MLENFNRWYDGGKLSDSFMEVLSKESETFRSVMEVDQCFPKLTFKTDETDFFSITANDCVLEDYKHMGNIKFDVAV
jgi:thymidylate synthase